MDWGYIWDVPFSTFNPKFLKVRCVSLESLITYALSQTSNGNSKLRVIGETSYCLSVMRSKLSILALYLRYLPQKLKRAIYTTIVVVILYSLIAGFEWVFACRPIEKYWDLTITRGSCVNWWIFSVFSG